MLTSTEGIGFVVAAYLGVGIVTLGLIAWAMLDARRQKRRLAALEAKGVSRRSSGGN
ncbi:MAG TPA: heme exporter protein CcmD [Devosiaceae bacterium]